MQQADLALCLRPGTDGALACAVMHVLFRDGYANWPYLEKYTDCPRELEAHLETAHARMGERHHRPDASRRSRPSRRMVGTTPQHLLPPRLRLRPLAQRRPQHARGAVHPGRDRRLAARGRRRLPQQRRHLPLEQVADRGPRRRRPERAHARSVAHRPGADGRSRTTSRAARRSRRCSSRTPTRCRWRPSSAR